MSPSDNQFTLHVATVNDEALERAAGVPRLTDPDRLASGVEQEVGLHRGRAVLVTRVVRGESDRRGVRGDAVGAAAHRRLLHRPPHLDPALAFQHRPLGLGELQRAVGVVIDGDETERQVTDWGRSERVEGLIGGTVVDSPISPKDVLATIYHLLGYDLETTLTDKTNRPVSLVPNGQVIRDILA